MEWDKLPVYEGPVDAEIIIKTEWEKTPFGGRSRVVDTRWEGGQVAMINLLMLAKTDMDVDWSKPVTFHGLALKPLGVVFAHPAVVVTRWGDWLARISVRLWLLRRLWRVVRYRLWLTACVWGLAEYREDERVWEAK